MKYRRKSSEVEAVQWTGDNLGEVKEFLDKQGFSCGTVSIRNQNYLAIYDKHGLLVNLEVHKGDYIVLHPNMVVFFDVIRADYFEETFERVE